MEARFKALLKTGVKSSRNAYECIHPVSATFTVADIGKLVEIICTTESESAVFHALVALLHDHINIRTAATPQIIEALVQRAISFDPDNHDEILLFAFQAVLEEIGPAALEDLYKAIRVLFLEKPDSSTSFNHTCILESAHAISVSTVSLPVCRRTAQVMLDTLLELQKRHARQPAKRNFHSLITTLGGELWKMAKFQRTNEMLGALRKIMLGPWRTFPYDCCVAWVDVLCDVGIEPNPHDPAIHFKPFPSSAEAEKMWRKRHGTTPAPTHGPFPGEPGYVVPPAREWLPAMRCEHGTNCGGGLSPKSKGNFEDFLAFMESGAFEAARQVSYDKPADQLMGCRACQAVLYCSPKCQRACWTAYGPALLRGDPVPPQGPLGRLHKDNFGHKAGDIHKLGCKLLQQIKGEVPAGQTNT